MNHLSRGYAPIGQQEKADLEKRIGENLPNGLEIGELCIPAGTMGWQLDDEYYPVLRYSPEIKHEDKKALDEIASRNPAFYRALQRF